MKKNLILSLLGIAALIATVVACSDNPSFGGQDNQNKELILKAKSLVQAQGNAVSLPVPNKNNALSRSVKSFSQATPIWDEAWSEKQGNSIVLIVPLENEDIRAKISLIQEDRTIYHFAKIFSRLIIRQIDGKITSSIYTYMPESNYATDNSEKLDTMGYYPQYSLFDGLVMISSLNGIAELGYYFENGKLIKKSTITNCNKNIVSSQSNNVINSKVFMMINFYIPNTISRSSTYTTDSEVCKRCDTMGCTCLQTKEKCDCYVLTEYNCHKCQQDFCGCLSSPEDSCLCIFSNPNTYCDKCGQLKDWCLCPNIEVCKTCGTDPCVCPDLCDKCLMKPCQCPKPDPEPNPDPIPDPDPDPTPNPVDTCDICKQEPCACCDICGTYPCICVTNTYPVSYVVHDNDFLIGEESAYTSGGDCCAMAVTAMAHRAYGAETTESDMSQFYTQLNYVSPEESTTLDKNSSFMTLQFEMGTTTNLAQTALSNVIIVRHDNHYKLVVGVQYDGDLIYADPHNGGLYVVNASYFSGCDNIVIYGNGGKSLKLKK